jgi:hypothetical protein
MFQTLNYNINEYTLMKEHKILKHFIVTHLYVRYKIFMN